MSEMVHSIFAPDNDGIDLRLSFFTPTPDTWNAHPVHLPSELAVQHGAGIAQQIRVMRQFRSPGSWPVDDWLLGHMLKFMDRLGIRPLGTMYFVPKATHLRETGGQARPIHRVAEIVRDSPDSDMPLPELFAHELAHLGAMGGCDDLAVLVSADGRTVLDFDTLSCGWERRPEPLKLGRQHPDRNWIILPLRNFQRGVFFEEATAQLVDMQCHFSFLPYYQEMGHDLTPDFGATVYEARGQVFEVPDGFGHSGAAWGIMQLDAACPGVAETLFNGARGQVDVGRLRRLIDGRFPGLFDQLDTLDINDSLAAGVVDILERLNHG